MVGAPPCFYVIPSNPANLGPFFSDPFKLGEWSSLNEHCEIPSSLSKLNWSLSVVPNARGISKGGWSFLYQISYASEANLHYR